VYKININTIPHRYFPDKFPSPHTCKTDTRAAKLNNFKLAFNVRMK